jgi:hypothetical protein
MVSAPEPGPTPTVLLGYAQFEHIPERTFKLAAGSYCVAGGCAVTADDDVAWPQHLLACAKAF